MGKELVLPDWLKQKIDQGEVKADADKVVSTIESVPRISLKNRRFNFIEGGEVVMKTSEPIPVVIVGVQPEQGMAKTFYQDGYQPGDSSPPDCSSFDGVRPDNWITNPVNDICATCPQNKWGSAESMSGGKAKACRDSKRLIIVNAKNIAKSTEYTINVTVSSLKSLSNYGKDLAKRGIPLETVITMISIAEESDFAQLEFAAVGVLNEEQGMLALQRANDRDWESGRGIEHQTSSAPALADQSQPAPPPQPEASAPAPETPTAAPTKEDDDMDQLLSSW